MLLLDQHPDNKSIMIAVLGKPNAGKSSLINNLLGFDLSVVTSKPQTTRNQFHCNLVIDRTEVVLVDTPGVHQTSIELNKRMNNQAEMGSEGADLNLLLVDSSTDCLQEIKDFKKNFTADLSRTWIVFTKTDLGINKNFEEIYKQAQEIIPTAEKFFTISTKDGSNIHLLTGAICDAAKAGPHLYTDGAASNMNERFFAREYIREQAFLLLKEEVPYELAVVIDEYKDPAKNAEMKASHISASIIVNRPSQRAIVVGKGGANIKTIGTEARKKIEAMLGSKVHLNLHVKVTPRWFTNNFVLEELGLPRSQTQPRVWRKK
jgi:GTP-binding protein Era